MLKILEKCSRKSYFFSKVTVCRPANLLKMNSFTGIFQGFSGQLQNRNIVEQPFAKHFLLQKTSQWLLPLYGYDHLS